MPAVRPISSGNTLWLPEVRIVTADVRRNTGEHIRIWKDQNELPGLKTAAQRAVSLPAI